MSTPSSPPLSLSPSRRKLLGQGAALAALGGAGALALSSRSARAATLTPIKLAWNANAPCLAAAPVAQAKGLFAIALVYACSGPLYWLWTRARPAKAAA